MEIVCAINRVCDAANTEYYLPIPWLPTFAPLSHEYDAIGSPTLEGYLDSRVIMCGQEVSDWSNFCAAILYRGNRCPYRKG